MNFLSPEIIASNKRIISYLQDFLVRSASFPYPLFHVLFYVCDVGEYIVDSAPFGTSECKTRIKRSILLR